MLVLGILIATKTSYEITSNKESGKKRYDILIRHKESDKVYVVELKKDDSLEATFAQMKEKEYAKGYSDVTYVAIVHNGKEVLVDMKKVYKKVLYTLDYNLDLGLRRARAAKNALIKLGISDDVNIIIKSGGYNQRVDGNYAKQRRVEILVNEYDKK